MAKTINRVTFSWGCFAANVTMMWTYRRFCYFVRDYPSELGTPDNAAQDYWATLWYLSDDELAIFRALYQLHFPGCGHLRVDRIPEPTNYEN